MALREQYEEHSERDFLPTPLATYHFETVVVPLHWHRDVHPEGRTHRDRGTELSV